MTSRWWAVIVLFLPMGSSEAAPVDPSQAPAKGPEATPSKPPPKGAPDSGYAGPPPGLMFEYVTPMDFALPPGGWGDGQAMYIAEEVNDGYILANKGGGNDLSYHATGEGTARVRLPRGAKIRWFDCAVQSPTLKKTTPLVPREQANLKLTAKLVHARYADNPATSPPYTLATVSMTQKNEEPEGVDLTKGVAIDHPRGTVTEDGWYYVHVRQLLAGLDFRLGMRACRVGYLP